MYAIRSYYARSETTIIDRVLQHTDEILAHLAAGGTLEGAEEPLRIYFTCYDALEKRKDPRAQDVLQAANELLEASYNFV